MDSEDIFPESVQDEILVYEAARWIRDPELVKNLERRKIDPVLANELIRSGDLVLAYSMDGVAMYKVREGVRDDGVSYSIFVRRHIEDDIYELVIDKKEEDNPKPLEKEDTFDVEGEISELKNRVFMTLTNRFDYSIRCIIERISSCFDVSMRINLSAELRCGCQFKQNIPDIRTVNELDRTVRVLKALETVSGASCFAAAVAQEHEKEIEKLLLVWS